MGTIHHRKKEGDEAARSSIDAEAEETLLPMQSASLLGVLETHLGPVCMQTEKSEGPSLISDLVLGII